MTFLKTILIVLLVYYGLKFILKLASPYIMRYVVKKAGQKFGSGFQGAYTQSDFTSSTSDNTQEGSITIDKVPQPKRKSKSTVGEYVDYEEID